MKFPKQLKIGGHRYRVVLRQDLPGSSEGKYFFGLCNYCPQTIEIAHYCGDEALTQGKKEQTLLHEILEAIDGENHLELDHRVLSVIATQLYQVMRDNKLNFGEK